MVSTAGKSNADGLEPDFTSTHAHPSVDSWIYLQSPDNNNTGMQIRARKTPRNPIGIVIWQYHLHILPIWDRGMTPNLLYDRWRGHVDHTMRCAHWVRQLNGKCGHCFVKITRTKFHCILFNDALCSLMMTVGVLTRRCRLRPYIPSNSIY